MFFEPKIKNLWRSSSTFVVDSLVSYSTIREAKIYSKRVALVFRLFQIGIIGYIIG